MSVKSTITAATAAAALIATPAFAAGPGGQGQGEPQAKGKATAPGQLCKSESRKKTMKGKGQSPFAACVVGVKRAQREAAQQQTEGSGEQTRTAPAKLCKDRSKKKSSTDRKSPYAACVSGAAKAQREQRS